MGVTIYDAYSVRGEIGKGGYSRVYRAVERASGDTVAVKVMSVDRFDQEMADVAMNEIRVMRRLQEELPQFESSFVQLRDVVHEVDRVCIIMELLEGGELFDRIVEKRQYSERDASAIMSKLLRAVKAMHSRGILHRDLKPENLLFTSAAEDADLKVMDFGLSLDLDSVDPHQSLEFVGTLGYVAPEVLLVKQYTPACDVFSLGVVLYILLVGRQPFRGRTAADQKARTVSGTYRLTGPHWEPISESAKDLVRRMLELDPSERISVDAALRHKWMLSASVAEAGRHLVHTVRAMRVFNGRERIRVTAEHVVGQGSQDLRLALMGLLENSAAHAAGLSGTDLSKVIVQLSKLGRQGRVTRPQFAKLLKRVGLGKLPADDIFQTLVRHAEGRGPRLSVGSGEPTPPRLMLSNQGARLDDEREEEEGEEAALDVDELVVGLSVVALKESRARVIESLFSFLSADGQTRQGPAGKRGSSKRAMSSAAPQQQSLSQQGYEKLLRVLASYERPVGKAATRNFAWDLAGIFGRRPRAMSRDEEDTEGDEGGAAEEKLLEEEEEGAPERITLGQFKRGVAALGEHVLEDLLGWSRVVDAAEAADRRAQKQPAPGMLQRMTSYTARMLTFTRNVGADYRPSDATEDSE